MGGGDGENVTGYVRIIGMKKCWKRGKKKKIGICENEERLNLFEKS